MIDINKWIIYEILNHQFSIADFKKKRTVDIILLKHCILYIWKQNEKVALIKLANKVGLKHHTTVMTALANIKSSIRIGDKTVLRQLFALEKSYKLFCEYPIEVQNEKIIKASNFFNN